MKHVMLVEDEVELAQLVRDYLEAAGFEVSMFHDGQEAYNSFLQRKPSLMILDLMVPRMDGLTICRKVLYHLLLLLKAVWCLYHLYNRCQQLQLYLLVVFL